jgi:glycosyltransferase involved in cell wall biosynthesis
MCKASAAMADAPPSAPGGAISVAFDATPLLFKPTGVGAFCAGALAGLAGRADIDLSAYAISWRRRKGIGSLVPPGVGTRQRPMPARPLHRAWGRWSVPPVEWFIGRHDIVHGCNFVVPPTRSATRVVSVHDLTVVFYPELCSSATLAFPGLIRRAVDEGAWVQTPSEYVAEEVITHLRVDPERVRWVHYGIPPLGPPTDDGPSHAAATTDDAPTPLDLPTACDRYVLAIGTIEPRKDYPSLIAAFNQVAAVDPGLCLVIVGPDGWGADEFLVALESSAYRSRIVRPGYVDDATLGMILRNAAVLAYPSRYEGFGFPPLQAMAAGVPVVATSAGSVPEVVGDGAVLVDPGDRDGLADALSRVLQGGPEVQAMVDRALVRSGQFTWERCAAGLAGLYRDALA